MSRPLKSSRWKGPIGQLRPFCTAVSMSSALAYPPPSKVHRFFRRGKEDAVDDEAPDLLVQNDGRPIDAAHEFGRCSDGGVGGLWALHHLAKLHDRDRVEEMHVAAPIRIGCQLGQTADGDGAAVAGEDRVLRH